MNFAEAAKKEGSFTTTENGALALNTSGEALVDLFGVIGALREATENRIRTLFAEAYKADPLLATKIVFYARDVREGLGERETFRRIIRYMSEKHPEAIRPNLDLIGVYGRYDDLYTFVGTPLEEDMWAAMKKQFEEDIKNFHAGHAISLLAKWIKTPDASSPRTRRMGIYTAEKLGYPVYNFKRILRKLRKHIDIVEAKMSAGKWREITYSAVPSRAMLIYQNAFKKHDGERFAQYIVNVTSGKEKINSSTLFPYDIVEKYLYQYYDSYDVLQAQWDSLPNYVEEGINALVIADTSGSMSGRPIATALGLAIYFAERNKGQYHNMWMSFSMEPKIQLLKGETLEQKMKNMDRRGWMMNTDLEASFELVLKIAKENNVPQAEMPKALVVISDMEIDHCVSSRWSFYEEMKERFAHAGYLIPNIIFWNVQSRRDVFHADATRKGVQLVSGQSPSTFMHVMKHIGMNPMEAMLATINSERYDAITVER